MEELGNREHRHGVPRPPHHEPPHHSFDADIIGKIFPCGYSVETEHSSRSLATRIGYGTLCNLDNGVIEEVPIDNIYPCQRILNKTKVIEMILYLQENDVPGYPMGFRKEGKVFLLDGHHRTAAQILAGKKAVMMHITDVDDEGHIINNKV